MISSLTLFSGLCDLVVLDSCERRMKEIREFYVCWVLHEDILCFFKDNHSVKWSAGMMLEKKITSLSQVQHNPRYIFFESEIYVIRNEQKTEICHLYSSYLVLSLWEPIKRHYSSPIMHVHFPHLFLEQSWTVVTYSWKVRCRWIRKEITIRIWRYWGTNHNFHRFVFTFNHNR